MYFVQLKELELCIFRNEEIIIYYNWEIFFAGMCINFGTHLVNVSI